MWSYSAADLGLFLLSLNTCRSFSVRFGAGTAPRRPTCSPRGRQLGASSSQARKQSHDDVFRGSPSTLAWNVLRHSHWGWEDKSDWLISYGSTKFFFRLVIEPPPGVGRSPPVLVAALLSHFCQSVGWKVVACFSVHSSDRQLLGGDFFPFGDCFLCLPRRVQTALRTALVSGYLGGCPSPGRNTQF